MLETVFDCKHITASCLQANKLNLNKQFEIRKCITIILKWHFKYKKIIDFSHTHIIIIYTMICYVSQLLHHIRIGTSLLCWCVLEPSQMTFYDV